MKRKRKKIMILLMMIIFTLLTTGCWNRRELNEIAIVTAAGIDPGPKKGEITLVYQIVNPSSISGKQGVSSSMTPFITLKTSGRTQFEAIRKATKEMSRRLYFAHLQAWVIDENLAKKSGVRDFLDLLYRDPEIREDIPILITKNCKVESVLSTQFPIDSVNGITIKKHLESTQKSGSFTRQVELRELINMLTSPTRSAIVPYIFVSNPINPKKDTLEATQASKQESVIKTEGFAVFKQDKVIGYLNSEEARAVLWVTDEIDKTVIVVPYQGEDHSIEIINSKTKIKTTLIHGKPEVNLEIKIDANVGSVLGPIDLTKQSVIKDLEKATNATVKKNIEHVLKKVQKSYKVDIFGFGEAFERQHSKEWKTLKKDWEKEFVDLTVHVKVNTTIGEIGMKNKSFQIEMKGNK